MTFEPKYEKLVSSHRKKLGNSQSIIECKLPITEGGVSKILSANAKAYIDTSEANGNEISFKGFVNIQILYLDTSNYPQSLDYSAEFKDKMISNFNNYDDIQLIVEPSVVDVKAQSETSDIKVNVIVQIDADAIVNENIEVLVGIDSNSTFTKKEIFKYQTLEDFPNESFDISRDFEIKDNISKILSVCPSVYIENIEAKDKFLTIKGGVIINICYVPEDEQMSVRSMEQTFDFEQEIAGENINGISNIQSLLQIAYNEMKVTTSIDVDKAIVSISVPLVFKAFVFNSKEIKIVTDVFNIQNDISTIVESVEILKSFTPSDYVERINESILLDDNMPFMDEVLGTCANHITIATSKILDNRLLLEGVAFTTVMYLNKEANSTVSYEVEMPFSLLLPASDISDNFEPIVSVQIGEVIAKGKRGKEIEINAKLFIYSNFYASENEGVLTEVSLGEIKSDDDLVLSIYIVKDGDTLWDISKEMNVSPDVILEQNPNLEIPLKAGTKIIIYKQKMIEF